MKAYSGDTVSASSKLVMHKDSHTISKLKPKIRIIHITAPEVIKTDVENFRDLVQRLTGKPAKVKGSASETSAALGSNCTRLWTNMQQTHEDHQQGIQILQSGQRMKREIQDHMYKGENSNGLFGGFGDVDNFIQDFTEYPLLPFKPPQMNMFGEMHLC